MWANVGSRMKQAFMLWGLRVAAGLAWRHASPRAAPVLDVPGKCQEAGPPGSGVPLCWGVHILCRAHGPPEEVDRWALAGSRLVGAQAGGGGVRATAQSRSAHSKDSMACVHCPGQHGGRAPP